MYPNQNDQPNQQGQPQYPQFTSQNFNDIPSNVAPTAGPFQEPTPQPGVPINPTPQPPYQPQPLQPQPDNSFNPYQPQPIQTQPSSQQYQPADYMQPEPFQQKPRSPLTKLISGKGKIVAIVGGILAVATVTGIAFLLLSLNKVSQDDYKTALDTALDISSAYSEISGVYIGSGTTETERKNSLDTLKKAKTKLDENITELGTLKAAKKDKDVKSTYAALVNKKDPFDTAYATEVEAYEKIFPVVMGFRDYAESLTLDNISSIMGKFKNNIRGITGLEHDINKTYVKTLGDLFEKLEILAEKVSEGRRDYTKYNSQTSSEFYSTVSDISDADRDWRSNMDKLSENTDMREQINDLGDLLSKKASNIN